MTERWVDMEFKHGGRVILAHRTLLVRTTLATRLRYLAKQNPSTRIRLIPSKFAAYDDVAKALTLVQKAGLSINMSGMQKGR